MNRGDGYKKAKAEFGTLCKWIEATPAARQDPRPPEMERWIEYFSGVRKLLVYLNAEPVYTPDTRLLRLLEEAGTRWGRIAK
jgi:hypothetical protein